MPRRLARALITALAVAVAAVGAPGTATAADPTGSISGTVTVPAGIDVTHVRVYARGPGGSPSGSAQTQPDGRYLIEPLPVGAYEVSFVDQDNALALMSWPDAVHTLDARPVQVGTGPVTGIDAHMLMGGTLSGTIHTTSDCDLTQVEVWPMAQGMQLREATVRPDGTWFVTGVAPATDYQVRFDGRTAGLDGYAYWPQGGNPKRVEEWYFTVTPGSVRTGIDVTFAGPAHGCVAPRAYVQQLYRDLLGRDGEWRALYDWAHEIELGRVSISAIANAFTSSDEFRSRLLAQTYADYLARGTDPAGLAYWLGRMRAGLPIEAVQAGFIASDEFYAASGGTPDGWVRNLYRTVLHRDPAPSEVDWWVAAIGRGMNRGTVAGGFLYSTEHLTTVVDGYYQWLLHRGIDPVGARDWVRLIQQGHRDEEIIAGLVSSTEYRLNVPR